MTTYSNFLSFVKPPQPQRFANKNSGIVRIGYLTYTGDESSNTHAGTSCPSCARKLCNVCKTSTIAKPIDNTVRHPIEQVI